MTEDEAIAWAEARFEPTVVDRLHRFSRMVADENERQNLISPATTSSIWSRHIVDSLQLLGMAPNSGAWLDIGTGGGFPGLALAIAGRSPMTLAEPRRKRAEFLRNVADDLGCGQVIVFGGKVERLTETASVISARAVASIENLLRAAAHCATQQTRWLLPRGSIDRDELADVASRHRLLFHVEQSVTSDDSSIVILEAR